MTPEEATARQTPETGRTSGHSGIAFTSTWTPPLQPSFSATSGQRMGDFIDAGLTSRNLPLELLALMLLLSVSTRIQEILLFIS